MSFEERTQLAMHLSKQSIPNNYHRNTPVVTPLIKELTIDPSLSPRSELKQAAQKRYQEMLEMQRQQDIRKQKSLEREKHWDSVLASRIKKVKHILKFACKGLQIPYHEERNMQQHVNDLLKKYNRLTMKFKPCDWTAFAKCMTTYLIELRQIIYARKHTNTPVSRDDKIGELFH